MYAEERQRTIVNLALRYDRVAVTELAERFSVTTETIRRDLDVLDRRGILRRVHGGAVPAENVRLVETAVTDREPAFSQQKARIAQAALQLLPTGSGSTVLLDSGTTTARLATAMAANQTHTVVTNSVAIASQLALSPTGTVHLLGDGSAASPRRRSAVRPSTLCPGCTATWGSSAPTGCPSTTVCRRPTMTRRR